MKKSEGRWKITLQNDISLMQKKNDKMANNNRNV